MNETDETVLHDEIEIALEKTIAEGFDRNHAGSRPNHSLSHGYFGNIETLLVATKPSMNHGAGRILDRFTAMLLDSVSMYMDGSRRRQYT